MSGRPAAEWRIFMKDFTLREGEEFIRLGQLLKAVRLVDEGSDAKYVISQGEVKVNSEVCTMRGKKLRDNDVVQFNGEEIHVHQRA